MSKFTIESGIERGKATRKPNFPFAEMKVDDSFLVPDSEFEGCKSSCQTILSTAARSWATRNQPTWKFSTRREGDATRVFRTA